MVVYIVVNYSLDVFHDQTVTNIYGYFLDLTLLLDTICLPFMSRGSPGQCRCVVGKVLARSVRQSRKAAREIGRNCPEALSEQSYTLPEAL